MVYRCHVPRKTNFLVRKCCYQNVVTNRYHMNLITTNKTKKINKGRFCKPIISNTLLTVLRLWGWRNPSIDLLEVREMSPGVLGQAALTSYGLLRSKWAKASVTCKLIYQILIQINLLKPYIFAIFAGCKIAEILLSLWAALLSHVLPFADS